jgi:hypothetical protein
VVFLSQLRESTEGKSSGDNYFKTADYLPGEFLSGSVGTGLGIQIYPLQRYESADDRHRRDRTYPGFHRNDVCGCSKVF